MRKDIKINVDTQTDGISLSSRRLGISSENLQGKIIFTPKPFIDGICRMYIEGHGSVLMDKQEDCYTLDIKSSLLITPHIDICFKITEPEKENGVPIFATKIMRFEVLDTIESNEPIPEQYPQWKDVLDNYTEEKKDELDTYTTEMQTDLKAYKKDLENEMSATKDTLVGEITATATDETNKFNTNAESKTNAFNDNTTEKTTNYNTNAETKIKEYNTNATNKVNEFNDNVDSLENELTELAGQMPWNTTEIQDSIHVEDSAKYSRNKLDVFGNLVQEKRSGYNSFKSENWIRYSYNNGLPTGINNSAVTINSNDNNNVNFSTTLNQYLGVLSEPIKVSANTKKYISFNLSGGNSDVRFAIFKKVDTTYTSLLLKTNLANKKYEYEYTSTEDMEICLGYWTNNSTTYTIDISEIMITDISNQTYEPYGAMPSIEYPSMPVVATGVQKITRCESNLFNLKDKKETHPLYTIDSDDWITISLDNTSGTGERYANIYTKQSNKIKPNTKYYVVIEIKKVTGTGAITVISKQPNNTPGQFNNSISYKLNELKDNDVKIAETMTLEDFSGCATMLRTYSYFGIGQGGSITFRLSLLEVEPNVETFVYKPYTEETFNLDLGTTELCKIVDENNNVVAQDRVVYKDGKWQLEKNVGKVVLDGTQTIASVSTSNITTRVQYTNIIQATNIDIRKYSVCNMLNYKSIWSLDEEAYYVDNASLGVILRIQKEEIGTTKDSANEYFKNNNLVVYYPLQETTYEDCTPAQSEVLDKLYKLSLQQGTNNIYVESENGVTTELQLTYMQDLMSQINELKQAMLNIGGN